MEYGLRVLCGAVGLVKDDTAGAVHDGVAFEFAICQWFHAYRPALGFQPFAHAFGNVVLVFAFQWFGVHFLNRVGVGLDWGGLLHIEHGHDGIPHFVNRVAVLVGLRVAVLVPDQAAAVTEDFHAVFAFAHHAAAFLPLAETGDQ